MTDQTTPHACPNCDGIDPNTCLMNPDRNASTPCSFPPCDTGPGEPCSRHEREWAHVEDDHELCGSECTAAEARPATGVQR